MSWVRPVTDVSGLGHTKAIYDGHRHLITALLAVCERGSGKVQGNLRRQRFAGNERFLPARRGCDQESADCQQVSKMRAIHR
jgi:hypothetical protein